MSIYGIIEKLRNNVAQSIVDALNKDKKAAHSEGEVSWAGRAIWRAIEAVTDDPTTKDILFRRIGYRPAVFQLAKERQLRGTAQDLFEAASEARMLLAQMNLTNGHPTIARLDAAILKATLPDGN
jgi:hypothetical protein